MEKILNSCQNTTFKMMVKLKNDAEQEEKQQQQNLGSVKSKFNAQNLELLIFIYATVRLWIGSSLIYFEYKLPLWRVDYYSRWLYDYRLNFDPLNPLMFWLWTVLIFTGSHSLRRLHRHKFTFNFIYQTLVSTRQAYEQSLHEPKQLEKIVSKRKIKLLQNAKKSVLFRIIFGDGERSTLVHKAASLYTWAALESVNQRQFRQLKQGRIDCMPSLSVYWRCQVARWVRFIDGLMVYILPIAFLVTFSFSVQFHFTARSLPLPFGLVAIQIHLENTIVIAIVIGIARYTALLLAVSPVLAFVIPRHLKAVHKAVKAELKSDKSQLNNSPVLYHFLREQHLMTEVVCQTNAQFFSGVCIGLMGVLLPTNIYFVGYFFFRYHSSLFRVVLVVMIVVTCAVGAFAVLPAATTECLLEPVHFLSAIQLRVKGRRNKSLKMKLDELMASLCGSTKTGLSYSIGPLANITVASIYEFLGFYIGYLLFGFGNFM